MWRKEKKDAALNKVMEVISAAERMYLKISAQTKLNQKKALKIRSKMEATKWRAVRSQETTQSSGPLI